MDQLVILLTPLTNPHVEDPNAEDPFFYILLTNSSFCIFQVIVMMKTLELHCVDNEDQAIKCKKHAKELKESKKTVAFEAKVKRLEDINAN